MKAIDFNFICTSSEEPLYLYTDGHIDKKTYEEEIIKEFIGIIDDPVEVKHGYVNNSKDIITNAPRSDFKAITYVEV
jgi:hypothetical protein